MYHMSQSTSRQTLAHYWRATLQYPRQVLGACLFTVGAFGMSVLIPYFASHTLAAALRSDTSFIHNLSLLGLSIVIGVGGNRVGFNSSMWLIASVQRDLHQQALVMLLRRSTGFHANNISGKLISDTTEFVAAYNMLFNALFLTGLSMVTSLTFGIILVTVQSWQMGMYLLTTVIITLVWAWIESRTRNKLRNKRLVASKKLVAHTSDTIVNAITVKIFAGEDRELHHNRQLGDHLRQMRIQDWQRAGRSGSNRVGLLLVSLLGLLLVVRAVTRHDPSALGTGIFAFTYTLSLVTRLFEINSLTRQVEEALLQASPMTELLADLPEVKDVTGADQLKVTSGKVTFRQVRFAYEEQQLAERAVFSDMNITIAPGEHVGLVGPSGGGKSTLTRLLLRFDNIQDGVIEIDGQDIARVTQQSLRTHIAYVPQEPLLFHRTIRENIQYGRPDAGDAALQRAARQAHAHEFIDQLPNGYDTIVGERGIKLSGGQRQRIAIARAILKDAPILVLDEATSALDSESERLIQDALEKLMRKRTAVVIAHRLSTIAKLDRIVVLDDGKIIEDGTHRQLLKADGAYAKLWKHQSGGFLDENDT